jgi:hypothetical protein
MSDSPRSSGRDGRRSSGESPQNLTPVSPTRRPDPPHAEPASVLEGIIEQLSLQSGRKPVLVGLRSPALVVEPVDRGRASSTGRHTGDLMGIPPTNREIVQDYVHILRF